MKADSKFAEKIASGNFVITAEYLPKAVADGAVVGMTAGGFGDVISAVNVSDNHYSIAMSSLAASVALDKAGVEPVYQIVTRDRNRIALQSDLLGAVSLGIKNVLCLSGYHQSLTTCPETAHVYDIDSVQLISTVKQMIEKKVLLDGTEIEGEFSLLAGAVANPYMKPLELNILRLGKKVAAGADFIQTQAIFDTEEFKKWLSAAVKEGLTEKTAIIAGVLPLESAREAQELCDKYTDFSIPDAVIKRLKDAGDPAAQKKEGLTICKEVIQEIKSLKGLRGIHILSGGKESLVPEVLAASGL